MDIKDKLLTVPGGWRYEHDDGHTSTGITYRQLLDRIAQHRANMGETGELDVEDAICGQLEIEDQRVYCTDAPPAEWPLILRPMKLLAQPGDRGLGDIVARVIGPIGGDAYKEWYGKTFSSGCGCGRRAEGLNRRYPL